MRTLAMVTATACMAALGVAAPPPEDGSARLKESLRKLQEERLSPPRRGNIDPKLEQAIRTLRSIAVTPEGAAQAQLAPQTPSEPQAAPQPPTTTQPVVNAYTLMRLRGMKLEGVADPVSLADALYLSGNLDEAATLYELALGKRLEAPDRAWSLFQLGNCRRQGDPAGARKVYRDLIQEHPDSAWADLAATQDRLLEWRLKDRPAEFLKGVGELRWPEAAPVNTAATQPAQTGTK